MRETNNARVARFGAPLAMRFLVAGVLAIAAAAASVAVHAQGMHGPGGPGAMMFGGPPGHMMHGVNHMLDSVNATDAQRTQVKQIAVAAAADLKAQHEAGRGLRQQGMALFTAPTVDANAAEALRQQMLAQHDQASKRVLQAMVDISRVLTPEQRAKLAARMQERESRMHERMQAPHPARPAT